MLPADPGTYALVLHRRRAGAITAGRLGRMQLRPGWYIYIGSAFGPGGLRARIGHHRRIAGHPHWHIDYLRAAASLSEVWYWRDLRCEHEWAARIAAMPGATVVLPGFGSSDCRCETHLYWFEQRPNCAFEHALVAQYSLIIGPERP